MDTLHQVLQHVRAKRWHQAHDLVQRDETELGAWLHGILHLEEGDLEDAEYWYTKAGRNFRSRGTLIEELRDFEGSMPVRGT